MVFSLSFFLERYFKNNPSHVTAMPQFTCWLRDRYYVSHSNIYQLHLGLSMDRKVSGIFIFGYKSTGMTLKHVFPLWVLCPLTVRELRTPKPHAS